MTSGKPVRSSRCVSMRAKSRSLTGRREMNSPASVGVTSPRATAARSAAQLVGIVRFDALEDLGGMLCFAVAMLDREGSGVVLSSINGRNETRIYAKPVEHGGSRINLSGEEEEAIRRALGAVHR